MLQVITSNYEMEKNDKMDEFYSIDESNDSLYVVQANMQLDNTKSNYLNVVGMQRLAEVLRGTLILFREDAAHNNIGTAFGNQLQEFRLRALVQSNASFIGPPQGVLSIPHDVSIATPSLIEQLGSPKKTWNEATYNLSQMTRKRTKQMTRTSAGEGSDSKEEFPVPENKSAQHKSVRNRRSNRSRARRAKDLTSNRKAIRKLPYVIHVDGIAKARGIHKHLWRAAVRGQCGRLDLTMDNINHHPKHVVDSIWHALEKEWEFEDFVHRAREMFERLATKFMRNRKMQLKVKCCKIQDDSIPNDVNGVYWSKIVDLTKRSKTQSMTSGSLLSTPKGKEKLLVVDREITNSLIQPLVCYQLRKVKKKNLKFIFLETAHEFRGEKV